MTKGTDENGEDDGDKEEDEEGEEEGKQVEEDMPDAFTYESPEQLASELITLSRTSRSLCVSYPFLDHWPSFDSVR